MNWFLNNWKIILIGITGVVLGILGNMYANKLSEKRIIAALTAEIESIKAKQQSGRITAEEQKRMIELQAQLKLYE